MQVITTAERTITEGVFQGKTFRYTNETPMRTSVIDWIMAVTGKNQKQASQLLIRATTDDPTIASVVERIQFPGERQRPTPVADARGLVRILLQLPHKYSAGYKATCIDIIARFVGADETLKRDIDALKQTYAQLPPNHPYHFFEATIAAEQPAPAPAPAPIVSVKWDAQRIKTKDATKVASAAIHANLQGVDRSTYARKNALIGKAVTGKTPSEFKRAYGLPKSAPTRDYWTDGQLAAGEMMEIGLRNIANSSSNVQEYEAKSQVAADAMSKAAEIMGLHNKWLVDMPASEVADAAIAAESRPTRARARKVRKVQPAIAAPAQPAIAAPAQ